MTNKPKEEILEKRNWKTVCKLADKYFPTHGCDNCLADLHRGCDDKCNEEFRNHRQFQMDLSKAIDKALSRQKKEIIEKLEKINRNERTIKEHNALDEPNRYHANGFDRGFDVFKRWAIQTIKEI